MRLDVENLNNFYSGSVVGQFTKRRLQDSVKKLWGSSFVGTMAGYGFPPPILSLFLDSPQQLLCLMPGQQGVRPWPSRLNNCSLLVEETNWPIATDSIDRLVVLHGLETSENLKDLFQEIWRVMAPTARVIFVVPNRTSWWARSETTPFGHGRPYSVRQLTNQLKLNQFKVEQYVTALYAPPLERLYKLKIAEFLENMGGKAYSGFGAGIIVLEASKQIFALNNPTFEEVVARPLKVLEEFRDPKPISKTYQK